MFFVCAAVNTWKAIMIEEQNFVFLHQGIKIVKLKLLLKNSI
jgi:hypothetical protein